MCLYIAHIYIYITSNTDNVHIIHYTHTFIIIYSVTYTILLILHYTILYIGINIALSLASSTYTAANITANNTTNTILNTHMTTKQAENSGSGSDSNDDYSDADGGGDGVYKTDVFNTIKWMKIYRIIEMCIRYIEKLTLEITNAGHNIYGSPAGGGMGDAYI